MIGMSALILQYSTIHVTYCAMTIYCNKNIRQNSYAVKQLATRTFRALVSRMARVNRNVTKDKERKFFRCLTINNLRVDKKQLIVAVDQLIIYQKQLMLVPLLTLALER